MKWNGKFEMEILYFGLPLGGEVPNIFIDFYVYVHSI